jgi:hypothetical protein
MVDSEMTGAKGYRNRECRAVAQFAFGSDGATMQCYQLLHQGQPDPRSLE